MRGAQIATTLILSLCLTGCWRGADLLPDGSSSEDGGLTDPGNGDYEDVSCGDLSPCVSSDLSGFTCPGSPNDVKCWDFSGHCSAHKLCASKKQACIIGCDSVECQEGSGTPPKPVCD